MQEGPSCCLTIQKTAAPLYGQQLPKMLKEDIDNAQCHSTTHKGCEANGLAVVAANAGLHAKTKQDISVIKAYKDSTQHPKPSSVWPSGAAGAVGHPTQLHVEDSVSNVIAKDISILHLVQETPP